MTSPTTASETQTNNQRRGATLVALKKWEDETGVTPTTTWRWRRKGWLNTVNICGRVYITSEAIEAFKQRAESGEFSKEHAAPGRNTKGGGK